MTLYNAEEEQNDSIYKCSSKLEEKGYKSTADGLICPLENNTYLKIGRTDKKYSYSLGSYDNYTFQYLSSAYTCKESITEEKDSRTKKLNEYWSKIGNTTDIEPLLSSIAVDLMNEPNFSQVNKTFNVYEEEQKKQSNTPEYAIEEEIEKRRNPKLTESGRKKAKKVEKKLQEIGFVKYLDNELDKLYVGKHTDTIRKLLVVFKIMKGEWSGILETIANTGEGKSLSDEILFNIIVPKQYIYNANSITKSSFTRYAELHEYYFDRMILNFGDLGKKSAFKEMEDLLNILKVLITEGEYVRDLSDKSDEGSYTNKQLKLKCDSIGGAYSSTKNHFTEGDSQLESRTISGTPHGSKDEDVMDYMIYINCPISKQIKEKKEAKKELKNFQLYLLHCLTMDITIINQYGNVFKRYAIHSDVPKRELKKVLELFDSYCKLTYYNCDKINGYLVASEKQINEFMKDICMETVLIPYESDFLKMIMATDKKLELTIIDTTEDSENPLESYYNNVLESFSNNDYTSFSDLTHSEVELTIKRLLKLYKLGGTSVDHKENVFFRISDIRRHYSKYKPYKNIDNVQGLIHRLVKKGYLDSIEYKDGKQNIYYLTEQCNDIAIPFELTEEDKEKAEEFLKEVGVVE